MARRHHGPQDMLAACIDCRSDAAPKRRGRRCSWDLTDGPDEFLHYRPPRGYAFPAIPRPCPAMPELHSVPSDRRHRVRPDLSPVQERSQSSGLDPGPPELRAGDTIRRHENRAVPRPVRRHARLAFPWADGVSAQFQNNNASRVGAGCADHSSRGRCCQDSRRPRHAAGAGTGHSGFPDRGGGGACRGRRRSGNVPMMPGRTG
jgi:hypothetical protein